MHWAERSRYNKGWVNEILAANRGYMTPKECVCSVLITLKRKRFCDSDNAIASCKPVIDAMRKCGILYDDSPKWMELNVIQVRSEHEATEIVVKEIDSTPGGMGPAGKQTRSSDLHGLPSRLSGDPGQPGVGPDAAHDRRRHRVYHRRRK
jgi:hypothetical protein